MNKVAVFITAQRTGKPMTPNDLDSYPSKCYFTSIMWRNTSFLLVLIAASCSKGPEHDSASLVDHLPSSEQSVQAIDLVEMALDGPPEPLIGEDVSASLNQALQIPQKALPLERQIWKFAWKNLNDRLLNETWQTLFDRSERSGSGFRRFKELTAEVKALEITEADKLNRVDWKGTVLFSAAAVKTRSDKNWRPLEHPVWEVALKRTSGEWSGSGSAPLNSVLSEKIVSVEH